MIYEPPALPLQQQPQQQQQQQQQQQETHEVVLPLSEPEALLVAPALLSVHAAGFRLVLPNEDETFAREIFLDPEAAWEERAYAITRLKSLVSEAQDQLHLLEGFMHEATEFPLPHPEASQTVYATCCLQVDSWRSAATERGDRLTVVLRRLSVRQEQILLLQRGIGEVDRVQRAQYRSEAAAAAAAAVSATAAAANGGLCDGFMHSWPALKKW